MNRSIISDEEYRELMRKQMVFTLKLVFWIFLIMGLLMSMGGVAFFVYENNEEWIAMAIPAGIMFIICFIFVFVLKRYKDKPFTSYAFEQYVNYQTTGTKIPLYRVISTGNSSQTIYMLLDISEGNFRLYDIKRKQLKLYFEDKEANVRVKFFFKTKNGLDMIKTKVQFFTSRNKYNVYGMSEVNDLFLNFLKNEGLSYEVQMGRMKSLQ